MEKTMKERLLVDSPISLLFRLSIPAVIGMLVIGLYPLMDGIFAGHIIGEEAMTACGIALPMTFVNSGISTLLGVGSASILSRALGKKDQETIDGIMGNLIFWVLLFSALITLGGALFAPLFLEAVGASGAIKQMGIRYLRVLFLGSVFVNFTQSANMVMRGEGLMKRAMGIMALGAIINIALDPILMTAMGDHAVEGAALATVIAQVVQATITLYYFLHKSETVQILGIRRNAAIAREMFAVGASAMVMQLLFMIQQTLLYKQAFAYGGDAYGTVMAATLRIYAFSFIPLWGMSQGLQPAAGANYGAKQFERVRKLMKVFCWGGLLLALAFWIPAQVFAPQILSAFNVQTALRATGAQNFRMFYSVFPLYGVMVMTITFFQAIGDGKKAGILVLLRQLIGFVPAMLILPKVFGPSAVWWAEPAVDAVVIVAGLWMQYTALVHMGREEQGGKNAC
ncbi:Multidrug export protein mepA [Aedoeadaptatus ivorii]|uniref:Multidrug export protein MepA n=1 Tax=Aedoeadaptatus ivorii TaxID=54006 RepID=A0A3S4YQF5_9FIRM|nr:MATE family efflux transporter [Peptoniphilus ivorii]MDQ0508280.1 putative MATE family efflux protein [Peptoniphilus ivorii]VEJ36254.1 Multidrug export protein mepA [Peptoniphilus ivorii]